MNGSEKRQGRCDLWTQRDARSGAKLLACLNEQENTVSLVTRKELQLVSGLGVCSRNLFICCFKFKIYFKDFFCLTI